MKTSMGSSLWEGLRSCFGRKAPAKPHGHSDDELVSRADEFNRNADAYWRSVGDQPTGRRHVLNRPFSGPTAAVDVYRLGLLMSELRLGPGLDVLDFGAGTCWLASGFNRMGCRTVAVDVSRAALDLGEQLFALDARQRADLRPQFLSYDGHRLPLPDASVDRIACYDAFHHVPNQDEILREMYRVLRPGGRVVMAEPGEGHSHAGSSAFDESLFDVLENDFDMLDIERRARTAGFTDMRVKPYLDPTVDAIPPAAYVRLAGQQSILRVSALRTGIGVLEALRNSFRTCSIVILAKGKQVSDSRCPSLLRAELRLLAPAAPLRGYGETALQARMELKNVGDTLWRHDVGSAGGSVCLGCHLLDGVGRPLPMEYPRGLLPRDVAPGERAEVLMAVPIPAVPGSYTLRFDPLVENVTWFSQAGSAALDVALEALESTENRPYRSSITLLSDPPRGPAGSRAQVSVRVENTGTSPWPLAERLGPGWLRVGVKLCDTDSTLLDQDYARADLPRALSPGEACELRLPLRLPKQPGRYEFRIDIVQEQVCWFEERGSRPLALTCEATADTTISTSPGVLRARLELLEPDREVVLAAPGEPVELLVRARNEGNTLWLAAEDWTQGHVRLGALLLSPPGSPRDYWRAPIPVDTPPLASVDIRGRMPAPAQEGDHVVMLDLVDEGVAWFHEDASPVVQFTVRVKPPGA